ncbi:MAG: trimeric autotransporter adhesin, partial [Ilumatobacteraceae bacterium]
TTTTRTATFVANDGILDSNTASRTITVTAVNDLPVNSVPVTQVTAKNTAKVFSAGFGNLISISDLDAGSSSVRVQLVSTNGTTTIVGSGLTFSVGDGTADATMTFTGTVANVNLALAGLSFNPNNNFIGAASLQIVTNDLGNTGTGGAGSDTDSITITVANAPVVTTTVANLAYVENGTTAVDSLITVTDADSATLVSATVAMTTNYINGQDTLLFVTQNGITGTWTPSSGILALSGSATLANYQAALRSITYNNNSDSPTTTNRAVTFKVNDGVLNSNTASRTITVTAVNDVPVITPTSGSMAYTENGTSVVDSLITVTDADSANMSSATVTITNKVAAQDTLAFINQNGITGTWTASTGILALSGSSSVANYQTALRSITYNNSSDNPTTTTRTVTFVVNDGTANSNTASRTITLTAVNDSPVNSVPGSQTTAKNTTKAIPISISDLDAGSSLVQVQLVATNGTVSLSDQSGLTFTVGDGDKDPTMTFTGTIATVNARLAGLSFTPTTGFTGAASLRIVTSDLGNTGTGGTLVDTDTIAITVT